MTRRKKGGRREKSGEGGRIWGRGGGYGGGVGGGKRKGRMRGLKRKGDEEFQEMV